jgi:hypothetical protein
LRERATQRFSEEEWVRGRRLLYPSPIRVC